MRTHKTDGNGGAPREELNPELRRIVEGIARRSPPERLTQRILSGIRRPETTAPADRPRPRRDRRQRRTMRWNVGSVTAIGVAACTLVVFAVSLFVWRPPKPVVVPQAPTAAVQDLPTAWAYHEAMAQSPEAIDALLARHARQVLRPEPESMRAHIFPFSLQQMP